MDSKYTNQTTAETYFELLKKIVISPATTSLKVVNKIKKLYVDSFAMESEHVHMSREPGVSLKMRAKQCNACSSKQKHNRVYTVYEMISIIPCDEPILTALL